MRKHSRSNISEEKKISAENQIVEISKTVDYFISEYTVELLAQKTNNEDFFIPGYQREFTWEEKRQSKFIESILMGLPIPFLFFWERPDSGKLEIVDGSQRLRTIQSFINNKLILCNLEKLTLINGFSYNDLEISRQRKFRNKSIRGIILSEKVDDETRLDLFERINTGSKNANDAEIRRAVLSGPFMDMIIELSQNDFVEKLLPTTQKRYQVREREELITRFFAYGDGLDEYKEEPSRFLYNYVKKMNIKSEDDKSIIDCYKNRLINTFYFVDKYFPYGFKKEKQANTIPRARFESLAIGAFLALKEQKNLNPSEDTINKLFKSSKFLKEIRSDGANAKKRLTNRINITRDILLER